MIVKAKKLINIMLGMAYLKDYSFTGRVNDCKKVRIIGVPLFNIDLNARLFLEAGVTLNSFNGDYHANLNSPIKIFIQNKGSSVEMVRTLKSMDHIFMRQRKLQ